MAPITSKDSIIVAANRAQTAREQLMRFYDRWEASLTRSDPEFPTSVLLQDMLQCRDGVTYLNKQLLGAMADADVVFAVLADVPGALEAIYQASKSDRQLRLEREFDLLVG